MACSGSDPAETTDASGGASAGGSAGSTMGGTGAVSGSGGNEGGQGGDAGAPATSGGAAGAAGNGAGVGGQGEGGSAGGAAGGDGGAAGGDGGAAGGDGGAAGGDGGVAGGNSGAAGQGGAAPCVATGSETCNGLDDDCNGTADDGLTAPSCDLTQGVCSGSTKACGGVQGWLPCAGSDSYGLYYVASEDGSVSEDVCDGLDNDCNGTPDESCTSGPLASEPEDEVSPNVYHRHLVYLADLDDNWDVFFQNLLTGEQRRLTTTPEDESMPQVYGNYVVFVRNTGADARVVVHDLKTSTETVLVAAQSGHPTLSTSLIVYERHDGQRWELWSHDLASGTGDDLLPDAGVVNERQPSMRGGRVAFVSDASGAFRTQVLDLATSNVTAQTPAMASSAGQSAPQMDYFALAWTDGRALSTTSGAPTEDWQVYGAPLDAQAGLDTYPAENGVCDAAYQQQLSHADSSLFAWSDYRNGNWDPVLGDLDGLELVISTHPATQRHPTIAGNHVFWEDDRLASFDIFQATVALGETPFAESIVINEILADPASGADPNGDGTASTANDEFVELVNTTTVALDLSGLTLSDLTSVRHTFPNGTVLPALGTIVVFGGGSLGATALFGGAQVQQATSGLLALDNAGDTVTLADGATVIDTVSYGTSAGNDESVVRSPELDSNAPLVRSSQMTGSIGPWTPGTSVRGFAF